jgi:arginine deiminase
MVELHQDNPTTILNIAKGLTTTIRKREEDITSATLTFTHKISDLEKRLEEYQNKVPLSTSDQLTGYILNDDTRVLDFVILVGDGNHQQAHWVKQLAKGQVAGLP